MKLRTSNFLASRTRSQAGEGNEGFQNSITALRVLSTWFNKASTPLRGQHSVVHSHFSNRHVTVETAAFVSRCFPETIKIPACLQYQPLEALPGRQISARLAHVLHRSGVRVLGDLNGQRVGDFAWRRNCGLKTLEELDSLASAFAIQSSFRNRRTTVKRGAGGRAFVVPKSVCRLRFEELPVTNRLANVARSNGLRTLGNLHGCTSVELLQYKACGWRTVAEIQQLIERAISGEFDVAGIDESTAVTELLTLLEKAIAKLGPRDRQFLLARIHGLTFAEIGRRHRLTRARVHQAVVKALRALRKSLGPRIPRLLKMIKQRCCSIRNGSRLTPALLDQWVGGASKRFHLTREAQVRLIAALDKTIPRHVN